MNENADLLSDSRWRLKENSCSGFCIPKTKYKRTETRANCGFYLCSALLFSFIDYTWAVASFMYQQLIWAKELTKKKVGAYWVHSFLSSEIGEKKKKFHWWCVNGCVGLNSFKLKCLSHQIFGLNILLCMHRPFKLNSFVILLYCFHQVFKIRSKECNTLSCKITILYDYVVWFLLNCHSPTF